MAHTIYKLLEALQMDSEYAFEEVPMPYDITINAKGAGTKEVDYSVLPARVATPLSPAEKALWTGTQPIRELQAALNTDKSQNKQEEAPAVEDDLGPDIMADDMPR